jgi:hypothetical protein
MTNSDEETEVEKLRRLLRVALGHADAYKVHFHHLQESMWAAEKLAYKRKEIIERQRSMIEDYEARLGLTDEL